jgi:hypothetical protein
VDGRDKPGHDEAELIAVSATVNGFSPNKAGVLLEPRRGIEDVGHGGNRFWRTFMGSKSAASSSF